MEVLWCLVTCLVTCLVMCLVPVEAGQHLLQAGQRGLHRDQGQDEHGGHKPRLHPYCGSPVTVTISWRALEMNQCDEW